jgi:putative FmdB family regulatory protein
MPTYEYECKSCGHVFDAFQSMMDEPLKSCPKCGQDVRRLIRGGTGVIFKGSGFYVTDKAKGSAAKPGAKTPGPEKPADTAANKTAASGSAAPAPEGKSAPPGAPSASAEKKASGQ